MNIASHNQQMHFEQHGYVVISNAIAQPLIDALNDGVRDIIECGLDSDSDMALRWIDRDRRIPEIVSDVLSPLRYTSVFGELFDTVTLPLAESLLDLGVRCSWLSLFVSGAGYRYATPLHRDNNTVGPDEEELLKRYRMQQCYFQVPLLADDRYLQVIPDSHRRRATEMEIAATAHDWDGEQLPGMITIELQPGDIVYRHTNLLHRGWNPQGSARRTLISGLWSAELPMLDIEKQDYKTLSEPQFLQSLPPRLQTSVRRYLDTWQQHNNEPPGQNQTSF